jgi:hypothetical protein
MANWQECFDALLKGMARGEPHKAERFVIPIALPPEEPSEPHKAEKRAEKKPKPEKTPRS